MMMEVEEAKAWTAQLSKAETDITHAAQVLEKSFKEANKNSVKLGGPEIPDPIKLVRRLTALEIALGHLQHDCEVIARKRKDVVQSVIETQYGNVSQVQEMLEMTDGKDPYTSQDESLDDSWEELKQVLKQQHDALSGTDTSGK